MQARRKYLSPCLAVLAMVAGTRLANAQGRARSRPSLRARNRPSMLRAGMMTSKPWLPMSAVVLVTALCGARNARADDVGQTCTAPKNVIARLTNGACAGFVARDRAGRVVQRADVSPAISGTVFATRDGKTVAILQDWPYKSQPFASLTALVFFREGKVVARYAMSDLVQRMQLVRETVSHVVWTVAPHERDYLLGSTFELTTTSMRKLVFDTTTGKQVFVDDTDAWKACDVIVHADEVLPAPSGAYTISRPHFVKGRGPSPLVLRSRDTAIQPLATYCVAHDAAGFVATSKLDLPFNTRIVPP